MEFSFRAMYTLIKGQGDKRVSEHAAGELREVLEDFTRDVAAEAIGIAIEEGSQTVERDHVRQALASDT